MNSREARSADEPVIIVSGLPRSGTSMMMQMLAAGGLPVLTDNQRKPDTDNPRGYYEFEAVKTVRDDASWLENAHGSVVKMVYKLLYDLPPNHSYRVIFVQRKLEEVIGSQGEMLRRRGKEDDDLTPDQLIALYERELGSVQSWLQRQPNFSTLYVNYRDVLIDPGSVADKLKDFLAGSLNAEAMAQIPDGALYRNRR
ncbi:MAG: sulfotransferase domain-containing protein [Chloroflexota bacterium]